MAFELSPRPAYVMGRGRLHDRIVELAAGRLHAIEDGGAADELPDEIPPGAMVVSADDGWAPDAAFARQHRCRRRRVHWLHCRLEGALGFVGPWVNPRRAGCLACAEVRRRLVIGTLQSTEDLLKPAPAHGAATAAWIDALARVALHTIDRERPAAGGRVYVLDAQDFGGSWHAFLPVSACLHCGTLVDDDASLAEVHPEPRPRAVSAGFRVNAAGPVAAELRDRLYDWRYGLVPHVFRSATAPLALSVAELPLMGQATREGGYGRSTSFDESETVALLEATERYAGWAPHAKRTTVTGSYAELAEDAVDPASLGLPDPSEAAAGPFTPYTPELVMPWVWAWSFAQRRSVLVPECIAYYGGAAPWRSPERVRYCVETSNGCALGASAEEATIHGLWEVAERDGFLMAWHRRSTVPEIDPRSVDDDLTHALAQRAACAGYELRLFDITTDLEVPSVWALLQRDDGQAPASFSAGGSSPDPARAVRAAVVEVVVDLFNRLPPEGRVDDATLRELYEDDDAVRTLEDHVSVYTCPAAMERLAFILARRPVRSLADLHAGQPARWERGDLRDTLSAMVDHLRDIGLDVLVVDQTAAEQRSLGLRSVKVIVPGTVPMTFGHRHRRLLGIPRLLRGSGRNGDETVLQYDQLNHRPHPFP